MSVCFFGVEELGNVAAWLARPARYEQSGDLERMAGLLAAYSAGNAAAFAYRYANSEHIDTDIRGHSAKDILAAASDLKVDAETARGTIRLLSYNGPEGEGLESFKGQTAYRKAMVSILGRAFGKLDRELDTKERGKGWEVGFGEGQD